MKRNWKTYLFWIALAEGVGALAGWLTREGNEWYRQYVEQPPLSPPGWVFPVVWTILYLAMGYAAWRVYTKEENPGQRRLSLGLYLAQLLLNFLWPIVFFRFQAFLGAFAVLLILWILIVMTMHSLHLERLFLAVL